MLFKLGIIIHFFTEFNGELKFQIKNIKLGT